jgi:hypothetical protein
MRFAGYVYAGWAVTFAAIAAYTLHLGARLRRARRATAETAPPR